MPRKKPLEITASEFGAETIAIRKLLRLTQKDMALRLHVTPRTVQTWEAGEKLPHHIVRQRVRAMKRGIYRGTTRQERFAARRDDDPTSSEDA